MRVTDTRHFSGLNNRKGQPAMPTQIALRLPQDLEQKVADSIADTVERSINAPYHLIGGFLVNANQLNDVMADQYPPFIVAD